MPLKTMKCYLEAMQLGAVDYLEKPVAPAEFEHLAQRMAALFLPYPAEGECQGGVTCSHKQLSSRCNRAAQWS